MRVRLFDLLVFLGEIDQLLERSSVSNRKFCKRLPIQGNFGPFQAGNETGIRDPVAPAGRVNAYDPQAPVNALFFLSISGRKRQGTLNRFTGGGVELSPAAPKPFGAF